MLLREGGAGGHSDHPYELDEVKTGEDLKRLFLSIPRYLAVKAAKEMGEREETHGSLKWDGSNNSVKIIDRRGDYEFALDRGSKGSGKLGDVDVEGVTVDDFDKRGLNPGLRRSTSILLTQIMNPALESHKEEMVEDLKILGLIDEDGRADKSKFLNLEYIQIDPKTGRANQIKYPHSSIVFHGVSQFYENKVMKDIIDPETGRPKIDPKTKKKEKEEVLVRPGIPRKKIKDPETGKTKLAKEGTSKSLPMNIKQRKALARIQQRLLPFARSVEAEEEEVNPETGETETTRRGEPFEVYTPSYIYVTKEIKKELEAALQTALGERIEVFVGEGEPISKSIDGWLETIKIIPNYDRAIEIRKLKYNDETKKEEFSDEPHKVSIYHRDLYKYIIAQQVPASQVLFENDCPDGETCELAIYGPVIVEITRILGGVLLSHLKADIRTWRQGKEGKWEDHDVSDLFGNLIDQEGVIVDGLTGKPFKITGQFIVQAAGGQFALKESFTVALSDNCRITKPISEWLLELDNPQNTCVMLNERKVRANSKEIYKLISSGKPVVSFLEKSEYVKPAIAGAIHYHLNELARKDSPRVDEQLVQDVMSILLKELSINDNPDYTGNFPPPEPEPEGVPDIVYIPGGFKPPHKGHLSIVRQAHEKFPNSPIRIISGKAGKVKDQSKLKKGEAPKGRGGITLEMAEQMWDIYLSDPELSGADIELIKIDEPLVTSRKNKAGEYIKTYSPIEKIGQDIDGDYKDKTVAIVYSLADESYGDLVKGIFKELDKEGKLLTFGADVCTGNNCNEVKLSSTDFRKTIPDKKFEDFKKYLPEFIDDIQAEEIWRIVGGGDIEEPIDDISPAFQTPYNDPRWEEEPDELTETLFRLIEEVLDEKVTRKGGEWCLKSKKGNKNLGCYKSKAGVKKREKQVNYFKHLKEGSDEENIEIDVLNLLIDEIKDIEYRDGRYISDLLEFIYGNIRDGFGKADIAHYRGWLIKHLKNHSREISQYKNVKPEEQYDLITRDVDHIIGLMDKGTFNPKKTLRHARGDYEPDEELFTRAREFNSEEEIDEMYAGTYELPAGDKKKEVKPEDLRLSNISQQLANLQKAATAQRKKDELSMKFLKKGLEEEELEEYRTIGGAGGGSGVSAGPPVANCKQCCKQCKCSPKKKVSNPKRPHDYMDLEEMSAGSAAGGYSLPIGDKPDYPEDSHPHLRGSIAGIKITYKR